MLMRWASVLVVVIVDDDGHLFDVTLLAPGKIDL